MTQSMQTPVLGELLSFEQWKASMIELLVQHPKGTALKIDSRCAFLLVLDEIVCLEAGDDVKDAGGCDYTGWDDENAMECAQALYACELFQRCTPEQVQAYEWELLDYFTPPQALRKPSYTEFAHLVRVLLMRHPVGTALQVPGHLDYILVGGLLSCIDSQSSIDGICLRDASDWSSMEADLAALRTQKFYQRFMPQEIAAYLDEEQPAAPGVDTTDMSALEYEVAVMELLSGHPKGTGLKDARGAIFIIDGELMHVADGKELEDATDFDPDAWDDTSPAPDIEALERAELVQLFSTAAVIAFEQELCS